MSQKTIMIVDDDRDLLLGLGIRLRASGYHVNIALDPVGAVSLISQRHPDLILLDLGLPGTDGFGVLKRLKMLGLTHIPIFVLTARDSSYREPALRAGVAAFFQKPVDNEELLNAIAEALTGFGIAANG